MSAEYSVPDAPHQCEMEIKRSQFITYAGYAADRADAEAFIREVRAQYPDARHVCWAYIAGPPNTTVLSMSDDGEPSGTAGRPMLNVLRHSGLGHIVVAVVRYFGGIKLGTGGLQRAYSDAVMQVLEGLPVRLFVPRVPLELEYDYAHESLIHHLCNRYDLQLGTPNYGQTVTLPVEIAEQQQQALIDDLTNLSSGAIQIRKVDGEV